MNKEEVLKLAKLARIEVTDAEAESLTKEIDSILNYVSEIKSVSTEHQQPTTNDFALKNVFREDKEPHTSGAYTEVLLNQAPSREGSYFKVKKIL